VIKKAILDKCICSATQRQHAQQWGALNL